MTMRTMEGGGFLLAPPAIVVRPFAPSSVLVVPLMVILAIAVCSYVSIVADGVRHQEVGRCAPVGVDMDLVLGLLDHPE